MEGPIRLLTFTLHDEVDGVSLTPANVDLLTLHKFLGDVINLIKGDISRNEIGEPTVEISSGSIKVASRVAMALAISFEADMANLSATSDLNQISPTRAKVVKSWQASALKKDSKRWYEIPPTGSGAFNAPIRVNKTTHFRYLNEDRWVYVEKYTRGKVIDMGGKTPNLHLVQPDHPDMVIKATESQLEGKTFLYKSANIHFCALQNVSSGELKDLRLIDATNAPQGIDMDFMRRLWRSGEEAWAGIDNPDEWLESIRG